MPTATSIPQRSWFNRVWRAFRRQPGHRRALVMEATLWLALSRIALLAMPFRTLAARFGTVSAPGGQAAGKDAPQLTQAQREAAREVGWAVTRAARHVPFRAVCLPQAIAAKAMLNRRGIANVMHFGIDRSSPALRAHAWLDTAGVEVTGFPLDPGMVEVARFL